MGNHVRNRPFQTAELQHFFDCQELFKKSAVATARMRGSGGLDFFGSFLIKQKGTKRTARQGVKNVKNF